MAKSEAKRRRPASTDASREKQLISLAIDLAEKQLLNGTAPASVLTHFLKLGATDNELEKEKIRKETILLEAKVAAIKAQEGRDDLYEKAIEAMKAYGRRSDDEA